jgi:hypothetical protein
MQVEEHVFLRQAEDGFVFPSLFAFSRLTCSSRKTLQTTEARILSGFGWGLTKKIESHGLARFKANVQRVGLFA